ncbi:hypothetical protein Pcinc_010189 [Petrolisthes cinctipes]|uniref:Uncharacterized protein n=1 Tax=Petrolisthes cinctipes TaxID=88211 RepID=A0AAE1G3J0_PETCI|nr:hypothetical protein Pcinc_010189 [Petrolisthes cinctipes]
MGDEARKATVSEAGAPPLLTSDLVPEAPSSPFSPTLDFLPIPCTPQLHGKKAKATRVNTATLVDMVETLLNVNKLKGEGLPGIVKVRNLSILHLLDSAFFSMAGENRHLDILLFLEWDQNSRGTQHKRVPIPAFPVWMGSSRAPTGLFLAKNEQADNLIDPLKVPSHRVDDQTLLLCPVDRGNE